MTTIYIYALCDPRDKKIRYVGQTLHPNNRFDAHCDDLSNEQKEKWIKDLSSFGLTPDMYIICETDETHAYHVERALIHAYATEKQPLVNKAMMPDEFLGVLHKIKKVEIPNIEEPSNSTKVQKKEKSPKKKESIADYDIVVSLNEAAAIANQFFYNLYPDFNKARNTIRIASYRGRIPGAWQIQKIGKSWDVWRYDKFKLIEWLTNKNNHKPGPKP